MLMRGGYPLTLPALGIGAVAGAVTALLFDEPLAGFSVLVLFAIVGGTWPANRPVIFPFILAYQWFAVTVGYFYSLFAGVFPSAYPTGDLPRALWLSLSGLLLLALGIRAVCWLPTSRKPTRDVEPEWEIGNLAGLFWLVIAIYAADYFYVINTRAFTSVGVFLARILEFRQVLLVTLWVEVLRRRARYRYLWISLVWVFVPLLGSYYSDFKGPLMVLSIVALSFFEPWERSAWEIKPRQLATGLLVACALVFVALVWQAGVKKETRKAQDSNLVGGDPVARVSQFVASAEASLPVVFNETQRVVEGLVERLSYVTFFSRVLEHVPRVQPHTNGELLKMAVTNAVMPRFLFPGKPELPSDSVYTRRFTGIPVTEWATSISIGYMAEFYTDWGVGGMMLMVFCYGCWIGVAYRLVEWLVKPAFLVNGALVTVLMAVYQFEHQFIKTFAALNVAVVVTVVMARAFGRPLVRFLHVQAVDESEDELEREASTA